MAGKCLNTTCVYGSSIWRVIFFHAAYEGAWVGASGIVLERFVEAHFFMFLVVPQVLADSVECRSAFV
jgi:hypothetical protein